MPSTNDRMPSPSASAAPRIMFVRIAPPASGLRPMASDDAPVRMPMPMPGPMTPKPIAIPAPMAASMFLSCAFFCSGRGCGLGVHLEIGDAVGVRVGCILMMFVVWFGRTVDGHWHVVGEDDCMIRAGGGDEGEARE